MSRFNLTGSVHSGLIHPRRTDRLCSLLRQFIPEGSTVLDVGCGDGLISSKLASMVPGVEISGCDVLVRPKTYIPVKEYDQKTLPYASKSFDIVMLIDVVHHADDPSRLMSEVARVARKGVLLKDHLRYGFLAGPTLRLMDWVGNAYAGVALPYNYLTEAEWNEQFKRAKLQRKSWITKLDLYPPPLSWMFDRSLHMIALLQPQA